MNRQKLTENILPPTYSPATIEKYLPNTRTFTAQPDAARSIRCKNRLKRSYRGIPVAHRNAYFFAMENRSKNFSKKY